MLQNSLTTTKYDTFEEAKRDIYEYVWHFYPRERLHASNGYMTPAQYYGCSLFQPYRTLLLWVQASLRKKWNWTQSGGEAVRSSPMRRSGGKPAPSTLM